jgi:hypothetical protein
MKGRYFLEMREGPYRFICGKRVGYETLAEAVEDAKRRVDHALPHNTIHVMQEIGWASLGGDGEGYFSQIGGEG